MPVSLVKVYYDFSLQQVERGKQSGDSVSLVVVVRGFGGTCGQHNTALQSHLLRRTQCCQPTLDLFHPMGRNGKR